MLQDEVIAALVSHMRRAVRCCAGLCAGPGRVIHLRAPFKGYGSKWVALKEFLASAGKVAKTDILIVVDAQDTLANSLPTSVFRQRVRMAVRGDRRVLFAAESACCVAALGVAETTYFNPDWSRKHRACTSLSGKCDVSQYATRIVPW